MDDVRGNLDIIKLGSKCEQDGHVNGATYQISVLLASNNREYGGVLREYAGGILIDCSNAKSPGSNKENKKKRCT